MSHKPWHRPTPPHDMPRQSLVSCASKYRHKTIDAANVERDRLTRDCPPPTGYHYNVYYCAFCRGYHIGKALDMEQSA
ncbi:MAG: hypothetical protein ACXWP0_04350 [Ktedonobacterales bacterium]